MVKFKDTVVDSRLFLALEDLVAILSRQADLRFDFQYGSFIDMKKRTVTASSFWHHYPEHIRKAGYQSDVILRILGTLHHTSLKEWFDFKQTVNRSPLKNFLIQLFTMLEDMRIEEHIKQERPGSRKWFDIRRQTFIRYFETQLKTNVTRGYKTDELFCLIYLAVTSTSPLLTFPGASTGQIETLKRLQPLLQLFFDARSTGDVADICLSIGSRLGEVYPDSMNRYFVFPILMEDTISHETLIDELTRADALEQDDQENIDEGEGFEEKLPAYHRENEHGEGKQSFLRYELDRGIRTNLIGDGARETEDGDQAMASVQGSSGKSNETDYTSLETLEEKKNDSPSAPSARYGTQNIHAHALEHEVQSPSSEDRTAYDECLSRIHLEKQRLSRTIDKALEHKQNATREHLLMGRLSKKRLLPLIIENESRIFYKKDLESKEMDAVFSLLIDCSASMADKMEETKKAAILFHEVLKELDIPHSVTGFWEDGFDATEKYQPNYFQRLIPFERSLERKKGAEIMQLEPREDNRDGFSIRVTAEQLMHRDENQKFLLVFTDGEPSAFNYQDNGMMDTREAVLAARKQGIEVIGIFLSDAPIEEYEAQLMENIYGKQHLLVPDLSELPDRFSSVLKRLLLKMI